ncbi:unnamed protein product, partial [Sphacelaria rigidula]
MEATAENLCRDGSLSPTRQRPMTARADGVPAKRNEVSSLPLTPARAPASPIAMPTAARASAVETSSVARVHPSKAAESRDSNDGDRSVGEGRGDARGRSG